MGHQMVEAFQEVASSPGGVGFKSREGRCFCATPARHLTLTGHCKFLTG